MTSWQQFNTQVETLAKETATEIKDGVESGNIKPDQVYKIKTDFLYAVNNFYDKLDDQLRAGYDPGNFDLRAAMKDLVVTMFDVISLGKAGSISAVAKKLVQEKGKDLALNVGKQIAGFDTPDGTEFKSPMQRTIEGTTKILGDNALGRTLGRVFGLIGELFGVDARAEYNRVKGELKANQEQISNILSQQLDPLWEKAKEVFYKAHLEDVKSNLRKDIGKKLNMFIDQLKNDGNLVTGINKGLKERGFPSSFLNDLIKKSVTWVSKPGQEDDITGPEATELRREWGTIHDIFKSSQGLLNTIDRQKYGVTIYNLDNGKINNTTPDGFYPFDNNRSWFTAYKR